VLPLQANQLGCFFAPKRNFPQPNVAYGINQIIFPPTTARHLRCIVNLGLMAYFATMIEITLEEIMNANSNIRPVDNSVATNYSSVWNRLHSERENICEALLKESAPGRQASISDRISNEKSPGPASWHLDLLQARLRKVDDALDRLMSGSYWSCSKCGRWIEDTKLDFDPAIAFCVSCWARMQTEH